MKSTENQSASLFGVQLVRKCEDSGYVNKILQDHNCQAATVVFSEMRTGKEVRINLAEGWGICGSRIEASGYRPPVSKELIERLLEVPGINRVVIWDRTGRFITEEKSRRVKEDMSYSAASVPLWISVVATRYANDQNRKKYAEDFQRLEDALVEAGALDDESLTKAMGRLTQEQIYNFYKIFSRMDN